MPEEFENSNSPNKEYSFEDSELTGLGTLGGDALKERLQGLFKEKSNKILDTNRQLFARAKKAEGFEQNESGEWIKIHEGKKPEAKAPKKSDDKLLERLDKLTLQVAGITHQEDVELFNQWKDRTKMEPEQITGDDIFQAQLEKKRTARNNQAASSNIRGEAGGSDAMKTPEYWIGKMTKASDGTPMFPDDLPNDRDLRSAIVQKLNKQLSGAGKEFYND